jgi:uncharacterized glyoxalase superfamily protein PhnB
MIRQIAPQFFTTNIPGTVAYYKDKLGFECLGTWQDPPVYAIVARNQHSIHFRCAAPPTSNPDKYEDELLDAHLVVEDADALYAEYAANGMEFTRGLANMTWRSREFAVKDCDGVSWPSGRTCSRLLWSGPDCVDQFLRVGLETSHSQCSDWVSLPDLLPTCGCAALL